MNQIDIGKFIADCRKEKGLTQAQLAEKLNITDRAVSKWETGKSMPDSSIMLELSNILGVTVNELLSGERLEMNNYEEKVSENLIELTKKDQNSMSKNVVISIVYTITMAIAMMVCFICDISISGKLSWSLITFSSIMVAWIISFPVILLGKRGIFVALVALSIVTIPFLYVLSLLIGVKEIFGIGAVMAVIGIVFFWTIYFLYRKLRERKLLATGIMFLLMIPFCFIINIVLSVMLGIALIEIGDIIAVFSLLIIAFAFIMGDYAKKKGYYN
ncbi:MAG: helix-turn-helix domain-containing protein [Butyrivibrio sp.]|nr:helix-turn-helix domain-containing protein [Butyrivibrio sp.]